MLAQLELLNLMWVTMSRVTWGSWVALPLVSGQGLPLQQIPVPKGHLGEVPIKETSEQKRREVPQEGSGHPGACLKGRRLRLGEGSPPWLYGLACCGLLSPVRHRASSPHTWPSVASQSPGAGARASRDYLLRKALHGCCPTSTPPHSRQRKGHMTTEPQ